MHTASANTKIEPIRTFRDHLTVCRSGADVFSRSPYGHHGSAGNGDVRTADEAGMMPGLTPVAAAARGARGESRREGVVLTCADLMPAAYLRALLGTRHILYHRVLRSV